MNHRTTGSTTSTSTSTSAPQLLFPILIIILSRDGVRVPEYGNTVLVPGTVDIYLNDTMVPA